jgi:hypothetical protein
VKIQDTGRGAKSVADGLAAVLQKDRILPSGSIAGYRIMNQDSDGYWDGVDWDGEHATFCAIRERDEAAAEKKLLKHKAE